MMDNILGERLRGERQRLGLGVAALAANAGLAPTRVLAIEGGGESAFAGDLAALAKAGVDLLVLLCVERMPSHREAALIVNYRAASAKGLEAANARRLALRRRNTKGGNE